MAFSLTILGSSSALPTSQRNTTAQVLNISERFFLIDCGEGTQIQLRKFKIRFGKINHIFISHLHGDHILGIFGLISSFVLLSRNSDLHIYCDRELENLLYHHLKYFDGDLGFKIIYHFLQTETKELIFEDDIVQVYSFPLHHRIPCCGFLFREKPKQSKLIKEKIEEHNVPLKFRAGIKSGDDFITNDGKIIPNRELTISPSQSRSFAFCSDTAYSDDTVEYVKNVDLLYHEATFKHELLKRANETYHSTALQAAQVALKANARKLLIGHYSVRYKTTDELLNEAKSVFENTEAVEDGMTFEI